MGRRYGNYGNCGNCGNYEYWGGAAMQTGLLGRRGKGACLQCCVTSRWGIQQTGPVLGRRFALLRIAGDVPESLFHQLTVVLNTISIQIFRNVDGITKYESQFRKGFGDLKTIPAAQ